VDDDRLVLHSTRLLLEAGGLDVVTVDRGAEAVEWARRERPDVLLLDVMMPEVDGWETLARLRSLPETSGIPVVIFTAREHARGRRLARELGAADYVQKPFDARALVGLVRHYASQARAGGAAPAAPAGAARPDA
jgi:two-component system alkaline phosphatase synthesis response regulator PhoP